YRARRHDYLARNGEFIVHGYTEWLKRYALKPVAHAIHPFAEPVRHPAIARDSNHSGNHRLNETSRYTA
ncbi:MAG TPA: hypothetical protein VGL08_06905, partial [Paraburkholderia sp.]